jgi:hypothetical protein
MIPKLAQCPYCNQCTIALNDDPDLVFVPGPCAHLAVVRGRYSQWGRSAHGATHMIGATELDWDPDAPDAEVRAERLRDYLQELAGAGTAWEFAPTEPFTVVSLSAEEKADDNQGKPFTAVEVDGWVIFAKDPTAFWAALPACQRRQLGEFDVG